MGLKSLMARLQNRATDTPDTSEKNIEYQGKAPIHASCTPDTSDTPCLVDARVNTLIRQLGEAVNDQEPEPPQTDPNAWSELSKAYQAHHFNCLICQSAGLGSRYGLRCGTGMALWRAYCD